MGVWGGTGQDVIDERINKLINTVVFFFYMKPTTCLQDGDSWLNSGGTFKDPG